MNSVDSHSLSSTPRAVVTHRTASLRCLTNCRRCAITSDSVIVAGVDQQRIGRCPQRRHRPRRVQVVAAAHVGEHALIVVGQARGDILVVATTRPGLGRRGQEDLDVGVGQHHGSDVAAFHHDAARAGGQCRAACRPAGCAPRAPTTPPTLPSDLVAADLRRNILSVKVTAILVGVVAHRQLRVGRDCLDGRLVGRVYSGAQHRQCDEAVHRTGVQVAGLQCARQSA